MQQHPVVVLVAVAFARVDWYSARAFLFVIQYGFFHIPLNYNRIRFFDKRKLAGNGAMFTNNRTNVLKVKGSVSMNKKAMIKYILQMLEGMDERLVRAVYIFSLHLQ